METFEIKYDRFAFWLKSNCLPVAYSIKSSMKGFA